MRQNYQYTGLLVVAILILALPYAVRELKRGSFPPAYLDSNPQSTINSKEPGLPERTITQLKQGLERREYNISYDSTRHSLQSPNRKQNLRAYYNPGRLTIQNRVDSVGHNFKLDLVNEGVFADGRRICKPKKASSSDLEANQLEIRHEGFTEQYINNEAGIRQNFIVEEAPENTLALQIRLSATGLKIHDSKANELHFYRENKIGEDEKQLVYNGLKCWDANGRLLAASLSSIDQHITIEVDVRGASYPVTIDPIISNGNPANANSLVESNQSGAQFGYSVSSGGDVNGDGYSDVIVGAPMFDQGQTDEGAVFIYHGSATGLGNAPSAILEVHQTNAVFGWAVSSAGDLNKDGFSDVVIGAPFYDNGQSDEGAIFVYHGSAGGISGIPALMLDGNQSGGFMGYALALAGDVNADGFSDLIIGAYQYDKGQVNEGVAAVYHGSAQGLKTVASSVMEPDQANAHFGYSVRGAGDVNGDGYSDVIVGSPLYDKGEQDEGLVFIYHGSALGVNINAATVIEQNQAGAYLGWSVSGAGDVNGDGYSDVLTGAPLFDKGEINEGCVFGYYGSVGGASAQAGIELDGNQPGAQMGHALAAAGDVNGDGYADVLIGAYQYDKGQTNEGVSAVYHGSAQGLAAIAFSVQESDQVEGRMGFSIASAGDVNGDGYSDIIIGAPLFDKGQSDEGAAFVWMGGANIISNIASKIEGDKQSIQFGWSLTHIGDVNGDGFDDVAISANNYDNGQEREGAAFVYHGSPSGLAKVPATVIESNQNLASLGTVSGAGDVNGDGYADLLIGVPLYGDNNAGAAFIYHGSSAGINKVANTAIFGPPEEDAQFGNSVACAGDVNGDGFGDIIIGALGVDITQQYLDEGAAFVYHGSLTGINTTYATKISGSVNGFNMGHSVSGAGDVNGDGFSDVIVGNPFFGDGQDYEGAAFVYAGSSGGVKLPAMSILQSNTAGSRLGSDVSSAGDINGDGYGDLAVGAPWYTQGQQEEGAVFIYYGNSSGTLQNPAIIEGNKPLAYIGSSVSAAGDINGDGYSDVLAGAIGYSNGEINEGAAFLFSGSSTGINANYSFKVEANQESAFLGNSVDGAGDVNGDGYGDILISAHLYDSPLVNEGIILLYYGGEGKDLRNNTRLYNANLTTPINQSQFVLNNFGAGLYAKSFLGANRGKLVWETKSSGQGFSKASNNVITNSTQSSGSQNVYTNLGPAGVELKNLIAKQGPATKVRMRVKYDPALALTGQTYGPWRYLPAYLMGTSIAPVPEQSVTEIFEKQVSVPETATIGIDVFPNPVSDKLRIRSSGNTEIQGLQLYTTLGKLVYQSAQVTSEIDVRNVSPGVYTLVVTLPDGSKRAQKVFVKR
jgi:hypothetical protein